MSRGGSVGERTIHDERFALSGTVAVRGAAAGPHAVSPRSGGATPTGTSSEHGSGSRAPGVVGKPGDANEASDLPDQLTRGLAHLGLSLHEAQMYRTVLRHGPMSARQAIHASRLDRATGYRILARLTARGLVVSAGQRPQRFLALDVARLIDRVTLLLRDEVDLHRVARGLYLAEAPGGRLATDPASPALASPAPGARPPTLGLQRFQFLVDDTAIFAHVTRLIDHAREEVVGLVRPQFLPEPERLRLIKSVARAVLRGTRVKLAFDYRPPDLDFLARLFGEATGNGALLEVRIWTPQLARLYVVDRKWAVRGFAALGTGRVGNGAAIASDEEEFVRAQLSRFQSIWREATPLEGPGASAHPLGRAGPISARELRRRSERLTAPLGRSAAATAGARPFDEVFHL